jgi:hypothetical protein
MQFRKENRMEETVYLNVKCYTYGLMENQIQENVYVNVTPKFRIEKRIEANVYVNVIPEFKIESGFKKMFM